MSNSSKPIKFAYLRKLANQSTLNGAYMIEITKACKVAFMKAATFLVVRFKDKRCQFGKNRKWRKYIS